MHGISFWNSQKLEAIYTYIYVCSSETNLDFFFFFKYCISRDVMQSNFFFPCGQVLVFIKD